MTTSAAREPPRKSGSAKPSFAELSTVSLVRTVEIAGRMLPLGATGTVVAAYSDGQGYEVEFERPFHVVATLEASDLRR